MSGQRGDRPERYASDLGTDTVPVKLVELKSVVGRRRSNNGPILLVAIAAVGIVAFALGASLATTPEPSPPAPAVAIATPSLAPIATDEAPSARPTRQPTPPPSAAPWAWTRSEFPDFGIHPQTFDPMGAWAIDGTFLVAGAVNSARGAIDGWAVARIARDGWELSVAPPAIAELAAGTVIDDRL